MQARVLAGARVALAVAGFTALLLVAGTSVTYAQPAATGTAPDTAAFIHAPQPAALVVYGDTVAWFSASSASASPARRAELARERIESLHEDRMQMPTRAEAYEGGYMIFVGEMFVFILRNGRRLSLWLFAHS